MNKKATVFSLIFACMSFTKARSLTLVPVSLLRNRTETLTTQAIGIMVQEGSIKSL